MHVHACCAFIPDVARGETATNSSYKTPSINKVLHHLSVRLM